MKMTDKQTKMLNERTRNEFEFLASTYFVEMLIKKSEEKTMLYANSPFVKRDELSLFDAQNMWVDNLLDMIEGYCHLTMGTIIIGAKLMIPFRMTKLFKNISTDKMFGPYFTGYVKQFNILVAPEVESNEIFVVSPGANEVYKIIVSE